MKKLRIVLSIAFITMSFSAVIAQETFVANAEESTITWKGYKPTGSHEGTITLQSGSILMKGKHIAGGSFSVDMASIKDADGSGRLEGHLKSKDFFEVEVFPTAKFIISEVVMDNDGATIIKGNMTIKGITKEVSFSGKVSESENSVTLKSAVFQVNRADFNVKYKSKTFFNNLKDKFVNDEFDLQVTIVATK